MKLTIENRKNTTKKGLEVLQEFISSFDGKFETDTGICYSCDFKAKITVDNDLNMSDFNYSEWTNNIACWRINDGDIEIASMEQWDTSERHTHSRVTISRFEQIDFGGAIKSLEDVIKKYNRTAIKKDM